MARLFDVARARGVGVTEEWAEYIRADIKRLPNAVVYEIDNVAEYYFTNRRADPWTAADFPNCAPPSPVMFFEHSVRWRGVWRAGTLVWAQDVEGDAEFRDKNGDIEAVLGSDGGWFMRAIAIQQTRRNDPIVATLRSSWAVDRSGRIIERNGLPNTFSYLLTGRGAYSVDGHEDARLRMFLLWAHIYPAMLATSFMHCKNVTRREEAPPSKLSRKWEKKHGRPLVRYHVLDIDPMRKVLSSEGGVETNGLKKALHICRGHFATYTEDKPLFGRVTGTFWKPQHVRGSAKNGVVVKDYNVKAPLG